LVSKQNSEAANDAASAQSVDYLLDNACPHAGTRFSALAQNFDPGTVHHLAGLGIGLGWRCLEIGGGSGSIASWLCESVGREGQVVATDIDTRFLERLRYANLEVRRHNIVSDPLPQSVFDLVHTRLVLVHLREREAVLRRLMDTLKPGGWILAEEFDALSIQTDPAVNSSEPSFNTFRLMHTVMIDRGIDLRFGRRLAGRLRAQGFLDVAAEGRMFMWHGGSSGAEMYRANIEQLRFAMVKTGLITTDQIDHDLDRLRRNELMFPSPIMWSVRGRRPLRQ
jgi:SAM-dependent methyltransferase